MATTLEHSPSPQPSPQRGEGGNAVASKNSQPLSQFQLSGTGAPPPDGIGGRWCACPAGRVTARIVLLIFMVAGDRLLHAMRLTDASFEVAGGVILFLIAMGMAFPGRGVSFADSGHGGEPMLVPPAIPVITGPSALATVLLLAARQPDRGWTWAAAIGLLLSAMAVDKLISGLRRAFPGVTG